MKFLLFLGILTALAVSKPQNPPPPPPVESLPPPPMSVPPGEPPPVPAPSTKTIFSPAPPPSDPAPSPAPEPPPSSPAEPAPPAPTVSSGPGGPEGPICECGYTYCASVLMAMNKPWSQKQLTTAYCSTPNAACPNGTPGTNVTTALYICLCEDTGDDVGTDLDVICGCDNCLNIGPDYRGRCETPCYSGTYCNNAGGGGGGGGGGVGEGRALLGFSAEE